MSARGTACVHCLYEVTPGWGIDWVHLGTGLAECEPTYAAPVFVDDPAWRPPIDSRQVLQ